MKTSHWLVGTLCLTVACSGSGGTESQRDLPPVDDFGVRFSGGETADFGNGTDDLCGTSSVDVVIDQEQAEEEGLDVDADRAWLALPHEAVLRWSALECAAAFEQCNDTSIQLRADVTDVIRVEGRSSRPSEVCPAEWNAFAYRVAVRLESSDGDLAGTFYARVGKRDTDDGVSSVSGQAMPDLRNFDGTLPIQLDPSRPHHAFLRVDFSLSSDGSASGRIEPWLSYYDDNPSTTRIGPDGLFGSAADNEQLSTDSVLGRGGTSWSLSSYPGSAVEPLVDLRVRADAVEPMADVDLTILVDGEEVHAESVTPGTSVDLGQHPFGTTVSVAVRNTNGAGQVRANVLQDNCFAASSNCNEQDCTTEVEYTAVHRVCNID